MVAPREGGGVHGCSGGHVHGCSWGVGHVWVAQGGMHGCSRGHVWLLWGACVVAAGGACMVSPGGHAWLLPGGGACVVAPGGGACMVAPRGGVHGCSQGGRAWDTTSYGDTINEWAVRILLECILVPVRFCRVSLQYRK